VIGVGAIVSAARSRRWSSTPSSMNFFEMWKERVRRAGASAVTSGLAAFPIFSAVTRLGVTAGFGPPPSRATTVAATMSQRNMARRIALCNCCNSGIDYENSSIVRVSS